MKQQVTLYIFLASILALSANEIPSTKVPQQETKQEEVPKEAAKETKPSLLDGMSFKGFAYMRYMTADGIGGSAQRQQYRLKLDATTAKSKGFSFTAGIFFNQGSASPSRDTHNTDKDIQGSLGVAVGSVFADRFTIATYYVSKELQTANTQATINIGRINLNSVWTDKNLDLGIGVDSKLTSHKLQYQLGYFDTWVTNRIAYALRSHKAVANDYKAASLGIGQNLVIFAIKGDDLSGLSFNVSVGNVSGLLDYLAFSDLKFAHSHFHIRAQVAAAGMNPKPDFGKGAGDTSKLIKWAPGNINTSNEGFSSTTRPKYTGFNGNTDWANHRGVYNIQIGYKNAGFSSKLGFLGSFGDGYGVSLDYKGALDVGGKAWVGNLDAASEGFVFMGNGGRHGTSITSLYLVLSYTISKPFKINLDIAHIGGDNNYTILDVAKAPRQTTAKGITFTEITPSLSYKLSDKLNFSVWYAYATGDMNFGKSRFELRHTF